MEQNEVVIFLLTHPPLEEIGGPIVDTIDLYRNKCLTKKPINVIFTVFHLKNYNFV